MREKKTLNERIKSRSVKKQSAVANFTLRFLCGILYYKKCHVTVDRKVNLKDYKDRPLLVVSNHASRMDYAFVTKALGTRRVNFVAAENEFHRSHLHGVFKFGNVIPKKNFVPDLTTLKGMTKILREEKNGCVCIFPCGMSTASGAQQPSMLGSGKMIKHFAKYGIPTLGVRIYGGYFLSPKFDVKERFGKIEVELFELLSAEQAKDMDEKEIQLKLDEALFTDDYAWNKDKQHAYKNENGAATNLHQILYKCPVCGEEMSMEGKGDVIRCLKCGNGATLDDKYNLVPLKGSKVPANIKEWFDNERRDMRRKVSQPDFVMEEHVKIGVMRDYEYMKNYNTCDYVGDGILHLDRDGLRYTGTRSGKPFDMFIKWDLINTICLPMDASFFYTYAYNGEFLQFKPDTASCMRWSFAVEEVYRVNGGKWQNYPWFDYEKDSPLIEG